MHGAADMLPLSMGRQVEAHSAEMNSLYMWYRSDDR